MCVRSTDRERGFTLVECVVGVTVLSLLAMGLAKLMVNHERLLAGLEVWRGEGNVAVVQRPVDPIQRVLGVGARLTSNAAADVEQLGPPDFYDVEVTSVGHALWPMRTIAEVVLTCYWGAQDVGATNVVQSVWNTTGSADDVTVADGSLDAGVFSSENVALTQRVRLDATDQLLDAGLYYFVTDASSLSTVLLSVDLGAGPPIPIVGSNIGTTASGLAVWSFELTSPGTMERLDVARSSFAGSFTMSLIETCVTDDIVY